MKLPSKKKSHQLAMQMIKETEEWFDTMGVHAGNRKAKIKIELGPSTENLDEAIHD